MTSDLCLIFFGLCIVVSIAYGRSIYQVYVHGMAHSYNQFRVGLFLKQGKNYTYKQFLQYVTFQWFLLVCGSVGAAVFAALYLKLFL